jgi:hypothetical protein
MIRSIQRYLIGRRLRAARLERDRASAAYAAAKLSGDTRTIHATHRAYTAATSAAIGIEMALRRLALRRLALRRVGGGACPPKRRGVVAGSAWRGAR